MKIRILVAVDRDGRTAVTQIYDQLVMFAANSGLITGHRDAEKYLRKYNDIDASTIQWRIVEAEVPDWQEPPVPVVKGQSKEVTL